MTKVHTIDATDKVLGRVASAAAKALIGRHLQTTKPTLLPMFAFTSRMQERQK